MNKKMLFAILTVMLTALLAVSAFAAETVYVGGDAADAVDTLEDAFAALDGKGGTVVLCEPIFIHEDLVIPEQDGDLTITALAGSNGKLLLYADTLTLAKNTNTNTVTFDMPLKTLDSGATIFGGFNSVHFTENFHVIAFSSDTGTVDFYGGVDAPESPEGSNVTTELVVPKELRNRDCITEIDYTITVDGGNFGVFMGGNRRATMYALYGSIAAKLDIVINGGTFTSPVTYKTGDALKIDPAFSISGMNILADDATLTITGGTFDTPIYANAYIGINITSASASSQVTNSDPKYYATDGDITIDIQGGTFTENCIEISAEQTAASFNRLLRGNFTLNIGADAELADGIVLDATQVKAYSGVTDKTATLTYAAAATVVPKRFDNVTGTTQAELAEPTRIACVGDSITQGTGSGTYSLYSYPAQLYTKAVGDKRDVIVSNYGCGATKVMEYSGLYYRAGLAYTMSVEETDADYVLIGLGTNDAGTVGNTVGQRGHFYEAYKDLVLSYTDLATTKMVYGTSPTYRLHYAVEASQVIRPLQEKALTDLAAAGNEKVTFVDLNLLTLEDALNGKLLGSDQLHPDKDGYTIYANAIYDAIYNGKTTKPLPISSDIYVDQKNGKVGAAGTKEDPIKHLDVAYAMADRAADVVNVHIVGTYTDDNFDTSTPSYNTPLDLKKIRYVGEPDADGKKATWVLPSKYFLMNCDTEFDNIILRYRDATSPATYFYGCFNNVTFTETFETPSHRYAILIAGHHVYDADITQARYTPVETISSDKDVTINILGGKFLYFIAGNLHFNSASNAGMAPYGIYSGDMTVNISSNATIAADSDSANALCGMNYLTGTITANLGTWGKGQAIREYSSITKQSALAAEYDETKNTGTVTINLGEGVTNPIIRSGDLNRDGEVNIADTLTMLKYMTNGIPADYDSRYFYDRTEFELIHVLHSLKIAVR